MNNNIDVCVSLTCVYNRNNKDNFINIVVSDSFLISQTKRCFSCSYPFEPDKGIDYYVDKAINLFNRLYDSN